LDSWTTQVRDLRAAIIRHVLFLTSSVLALPQNRGAKHDITVFKEGLADKLDAGEMVEADKGYTGLKVNTRRTPHDCENVDEWLEKSDIRARQESVNRRFKVFGILKHHFRIRDRKQHGLVFRAIVAITQLNISRGNVLFQVEPTIKKKHEYCI
jgi:hypothetical protein